MASVSGTSSLGNTSLRGFGGLASGIDRDSIIEQMTLGTTTKINNQKKAMTSLNWRQEAFQSISDKILNLQDNFFSFSAGVNLKTATLFAKSQISVLGDSSVTKYVTATGTSNLVDYVSIKGVSQLATSASTTSSAKGTSSISTGITADKLNYDDTDPNKNIDNACKTSVLHGTKLTFGKEVDGSFKAFGSFTFPGSYKRTITGPDGTKTTETVEIDYTTDNVNALKDQLNEALQYSDMELGDVKIADAFKFELNDDGKSLKIVANKQDAYDEVVNNGFKISENSSALNALGYSKPAGADTKNGISFEEFGNNTSDFLESAIKRESALDYMAGKKFSISFGGQTKEVELLSKADAEALKAGGTVSMDDVVNKINEKLGKAFGKGQDGAGKDIYNVEAFVDTDGALKFRTGELAATSGGMVQTLTVTSNDSEVRKNLDILNGASNKLSLDASIADNWDKLGFGSEAEMESALAGGFKINGITIDGVTKDTTIKQLMDKINSNKEAGVKATYLSSTNQFVLLATESGTGRKINLGDPDSAANQIFGTTNAADIKDGTNAKILVSYGDGIETTMESSSNTFNLEGMQVTVSGTFNADGSDPTKAVTFSAKPNVDEATEKIKKFIEEYNTLVKEINKQITTKPSSSYGPLTDEQKDEMSETSIENWEKKAKEGLLFNDSTMRDLSMDIQNVMTKLMNNGVNPNDLEKIGITVSDDYTNGGELVFDEAKFRDAMTNDSELVSNIISGGGTVSKGLAQVIEDTLTPYATRYAAKNGNSYGRLIEEAGSEKVPLSVTKNQIYNQLKEMEKAIEKLQERLSVEQDRYISQFSTMESLISQMNSQAGWLAGLSA